jgi:hypothetical protein
MAGRWNRAAMLTGCPSGRKTDEGMLSNIYVMDVKASKTV